MIVAFMQIVSTQMDTTLAGVMKDTQETVIFVVISMSVKHRMMFAVKTRFVTTLRVVSRVAVQKDTQEMGLSVATSMSVKMTIHSTIVEKTQYVKTRRVVSCARVQMVFRETDLTVKLYCKEISLGIHHNLERSVKHLGLQKKKNFQYQHNDKICSSPKNYISSVNTHLI